MQPSAKIKVIAAPQLRDDVVFAAIKHEAQLMITYAGTRINTGVRARECTRPHARARTHEHADRVCTVYSALPTKQRKRFKLNYI